MKKQSYRFPKRRRIVSSEDFTRVLRKGGCAADGTLVVFALPRGDADDTTRLGITVPKKTGNAVIRNRWKRLVREAFRLRQDDFPSGYDLVVRPKKDATLCSLSIRGGLLRLSVKATRRYRDKSRHR